MSHVPSRCHPTDRHRSYFPNPRRSPDYPCRFGSDVLEDLSPQLLDRLLDGHRDFPGITGERFAQAAFDVRQSFGRFGSQRT